MEDRNEFRFFDNREKFLLFAMTCSEKQDTAKRIGRELKHLNPKPPALRLFQAGSGEGTQLSLVLREFHHRWPHLPYLVAIKEYSAEMIRVAMRNLADRFREHPDLVLVLNNLPYRQAPSFLPERSSDIERLNWREVALQGTSSHGYEEQINHALQFVDEGWEIVGRSLQGSPIYSKPSVLVLYRSDHAFALDAVIPRRGTPADAFDLVIASHPYRARLPAESKVRRVLAPLASSLAPGGRMIGIQSCGNDPGMEIINALWPDEAPFPTSTEILLRELENQLTGRLDDLEFSQADNVQPKFKFHLQLNPNDVVSSIGTSTLLAAWNAATYVAQIDEQRVTDSMQHGAYLDVTTQMLEKHQGMWFNNECFVVSRRAEA